MPTAGWASVAVSVGRGVCRGGWNKVGAGSVLVGVSGSLAVGVLAPIGATVGVICASGVETYGPPNQPARLRPSGPPSNTAIMMIDPGRSASPAIKAMAFLRRTWRR